MAEAYFDDSGTHDQSPVVVWGGLIGRTEQWEFLERKWRERLREPLPGKPPLKQFHLSHCAALDGEFQNYKRAESDHLRWLFRQIIADAKLEASGWAISRPDWEELVQGKAKILLGSHAEVMCVGACLKWAFERTAKVRDDMLIVGFDLGRWSPELTDWIQKGTRAYAGPVTPVDIGFHAIVQTPALQAADTIATETYWFAQSKLAGNATLSAHFKSLLGKIHASGNILDRAHITEVVRKINRRP